jgi:hypothetical protein
MGASRIVDLLHEGGAVATLWLNECFGGVSGCLGVFWGATEQEESESVSGQRKRDGRRRTEEGSITTYLTLPLPLLISTALCLYSAPCTLCLWLSCRWYADGMQPAGRRASRHELT